MLQEHVYRVRIRDTDELRKRLVATWTEFQHSVVDYAVDQQRKRLEDQNWSLFLTELFENKKVDFFLGHSVARTVYNDEDKILI